MTRLEQFIEQFSSQFDYKHYNHSDYAKDNSLKFSGLSILIIAYLSHHFIYPIMTMASGMLLRRDDLDMTAPLRLLSDSTLVLASLPAVLIFLLSALRNASSPSWVRWLWCHGRFWLLSAASAGAVLLIWLAKTQVNGPLLIYLLLDGGIVFYILLSRRLKDSFASFPVQVPEMIQ